MRGQTKPYERFLMKRQPPQRLWHYVQRLPLVPLAGEPKSQTVE